MKLCKISTYSVLILGILSQGCLFDKNQITVNVDRNKGKSKVQGDNLSSAIVTKVEVINNQLVISGSNLSNVTNVNLKNPSLTFNEGFSVESVTTNKIIANGTKALTMAVSAVFDLVISNAYGAASFTIDFSLCNATLASKTIDCTVALTDKSVLSYDAVSQTWKPRQVNGLNYLGAWDASTHTVPTVQASGSYYIVGVAGDIGGFYTVNVGDWIVSNGSSWQKIDNSTVITSVFGRTGAVVGAEADYTLDLLGDVDLTTTPPTSGKVLKYDGAHWVPSDDLSGGGVGSVTTSAIADGAVTDVKINSLSASKITGSISSAQIADGSIVNADVSASAAIDYSKLNIPAGSIPYAKLNIADGDIPSTKISGLGTTVTSYIEDTINDAITGKAPSENAVYDALQLKLDKTGGTITSSLNVPTPILGTEVANKDYVDNSLTTTTTTLNTSIGNKVAKAGDTMSGDLTLDTQAKFKSGSYYTTVKGSASSTGNYTITLPISGGVSGYVLRTDGTGVTSWVNPATLAAGSNSVDSSAIIDDTIIDADVSSIANIAQSKIAGLTTALSGKEPTISAGTTAQYYRGDKTWSTLATDAINSVISTFTIGSNATIANTDSIVAAFGKTQGQINAINTTLSGMSTSQWSDSSGNVYRSSGNVGIATTSPTEKLHVVGNVLATGAVKLQDSTTNTINVQAPSTVTSYSITLPSAAGTNGQLLKTTGSGNLVWSTLPTCSAGEVLKADGTNFSCVTDNTGAGAFSGNNNVAVVTNGSGALTSSATTATEVSYLSGVTSSIQTQLNNKEPTITAGTTAQYIRGDKTLSTFATDAINSVISTFTVGSNATIANSDSIVAAFGKTQGQINAINSSITTTNTNLAAKADLTNIAQTITAATVTGLSTPVANSDAANKQYVDSAISGNLVPAQTGNSGKYLTTDGTSASWATLVSSQWTTSGSDIYYNSGNVGIGTTSPLNYGGNYKVLDVRGGSTTEGGVVSVGNFDNSVYGQFGMSGAGPGIVLKSVSNHPLFFSTNNTERMRIAAGGNVGVGTTTPQTKLDVNGSVRIADDATTCSATIAGAMRFHLNNVEYCNGTSWITVSTTGTGSVTSTQIADGTIVDADISGSAAIDQSKISGLTTALTSLQPIDTTLTSLAAYNTNGILVQTAADTFTGRSIASTANRTVVTNGDGVAGNPTINIDTTLLPSPVAGDAGKFLKASGANASAWAALGSSDITTALGFTPINKAGDTISAGTVAFNGAGILSVPTPVNLTDAVNKSYVDGFGQWTKSGSNIYFSSGNVGIGTSSIDTNAILDITSTTKGFLPPRLTSTQRDAIGSPSAGLTIYNTTTTQYEFYNGTNWNSMGGGVPNGTIAAFASTTCPAGWTEYTAARGKFLRAIDNGAGYDPDGTRAPGNYQADDNKTHTHTGTSNSAGDHGHTGTTASSGAHSHTVPAYYANSTAVLIVNDSNSDSLLGTDNATGGYSSNVRSTDSAGAHTHTFTTSTTGAHTHTFTSDATGGSEARPKNIAVLYCVYSGGTPTYTPPNLDVLGTVNISSPTNNQVLTYNSATSKWINQTIATTLGYTPANKAGETFTGNVGIGVAPTYRLDVSGGTRLVASNSDIVWTERSDSSLDISQVSTTTATKRGLSIHQYSSANILDTYYYTGGSFASRFYISSAGNGWMAGTLTQASDARLKTNIEKIPNALDKLLTLDGIFYKWKDKTKGDEKQMGLIAQNVQKVFPEAVRKNQDGFLSVAYQNLVAPIIEALKEIKNWITKIDKDLFENKRDIASVKSKVTKQDDEIKKLKEENEHLKKEIEEIKRSLKTKK